MASECLDTYVRYYRASTPNQPNGDGRDRTFKPTDQLSTNQLNRLIADPQLSEISGVVPLVDEPNVEVGDAVRIRFSASPKNRVFESRADVFSLPNMRASQAFFILESGVYSADDPPPGEAEAYDCVCQLIERVRRLSASGDLAAGALGFVAGGEFIKVAGAVEYRYLGVNEREAVAKLVNYIDQHEDNVHFPDIFAKSLVQHVRSERERDRIQYLVWHAGDLLETLVLEYKIVMSAFSLNSVEQELREARTGFISRVNKVLSDIQTQLLGIPVSAIVVATQIRPVKESSFQLAVNIGILAAALIFAVFFCLLLWNQKHTLKAISLELQMKQETFRAALGDKSALAETVFTAVRDRLTHQYMTFRVVAAIVFIGALAAIAIFIHAAQFTDHDAKTGVPPSSIVEPSANPPADR